MPKYESRILLICNKLVRPAVGSDPAGFENIAVIGDL